MRVLQTGSVIVSLIPFNIELLLSASNGTTTEVDPFALTGIVRNWMEETFVNASLGDDFAPFQSILLNLQEDQQVVDNLTPTQTVLTAPYEGVSVWETSGEDLTVPDETTVLGLQIEALVNQDEALLQALQESDATGLGDAVINVKGSITNNKPDVPDTPSPSSGDDGLDVVIIVAIIIAILALALLIFALVMAWRYKASLEGPQDPKKKKKMKKSQANPPESVQSARASKAAISATTPPSEIDPEDGAGGLYPESIISEDISTSLTAYYRSGLGSYSTNRNNTSGGLNDAASVSSMESYGYSLDGYTSSIVPSKDEESYDYQ